MKGHSDVIYALVELSDKRIVSASGDRTLRVWNPIRRGCDGVLKGHSGWVQSLTLLDDGRLASGGDDHTIIIWYLMG